MHFKIEKNNLNNYFLNWKNVMVQTIGKTDFLAEKFDKIPIFCNIFDVRISFENTSQF